MTALPSSALACRHISDSIDKDIPSASLPLHSHAVSGRKQVALMPPQQLRGRKGQSLKLVDKGQH